MSSGSKALIAAIIVIALIIIGVSYSRKGSDAPAPASDTQSAAVGNSSKDSSDAQLDKDTAALDAQISASASDTADVDSSLNDKQAQ